MYVHITDMTVPFVCVCVCRCAGTLESMVVSGWQLPQTVASFSCSECPPPGLRLLVFKEKINHLINSASPPIIIIPLFIVYYH